MTTPAKTDPWLLMALGVAVHVGWALQVPAPTDVDPSYYRLVARHIAEGDGAVTSAVWQLLHVPESLPAPADLHWMPIPSRVLVPGMLLWPGFGPELTNAVIAALWAPIAWALALELREDRWTALLAGILASWVPGFLRRMDTPDSIALYGAVGGLAFLAASRDRWLAAAGLCAAAALTRNDGLLLAPCVALALAPSLKALAVAASGPLASAAWTARNTGLGGEGYLDARRAIGQLADKSGLLGAEPTAMGLTERLSFAWNEGLGVALVVWLLVLPLPGVLALPSRVREHRVARAGAAYALGLPLAAVFLAPGVATYGSMYRSSAALVPLLAAVSAASLAGLGRWAAEHSEIPAPALPGVFLGIWVGTLTVAGPMKAGRLPPVGEAECALLAEVDTPLFTADPLFAAERCGVQTVLHSAYDSEEERSALAERFAIRWALAPRADDSREHIMTEPDPGWEPVGQRLWRKK